MRTIVALIAFDSCTEKRGRTQGEAIEKNSLGSCQQMIKIAPLIMVDISRAFLPPDLRVLVRPRDSRFQKSRITALSKLDPRQISSERCATYTLVCVIVDIPRSGRHHLRLIWLTSPSSKKNPRERREDAQIESLDVLLGISFRKRALECDGSESSILNYRC